MVTTCHASVGEKTDQMCEREKSAGWSTDGNVRCRIDRWDPFECRLDAREVEESESARDSSSDFGRWCRLRCEGGPAKGIHRSAVTGLMEMYDTKRATCRCDQSPPRCLLPWRNQDQIVLSSWGLISRETVA